MLDVVYNFNGWVGSIQGEFFFIKDGLIVLGVQVGKVFVEFKFFFFNSECLESVFFGSFYDIWQSVCVDIEKLVYLCLFEF